MQILRRELNQEYLTSNSQMDLSHLSRTLQISCCDPAGYTLVKDAALIEINQAWSLLLPWQLYSGLLSHSIGWHLVALGSDWFKCVKVDNYSANINHEQWAVTMRVWRENFIQLKARKLLSGLSIPIFFSASWILSAWSLVMLMYEVDVTILMWLADPDLDHDSENCSSNYPHEVWRTPALMDVLLYLCHSMSALSFEQIRR